LPPPTGPRTTRVWTLCFFVDYFHRANPHSLPKPLPPPSDLDAILDGRPNGGFQINIRRATTHELVFTPPGFTPHSLVNFLETSPGFFPNSANSLSVDGSVFSYSAPHKTSQTPGSLLLTSPFCTAWDLGCDATFCHFGESPLGIHCPIGLSKKPLPYSIYSPFQFF